jgi:hypothetical protein
MLIDVSSSEGQQPDGGTATPHISGLFYCHNFSMSTTTKNSIEFPGGDLNRIPATGNS